MTKIERIIYNLLMGIDENIPINSHKKEYEIPGIPGRKAGTVIGKELIRMEGICKYFPGVKALDHVSLKVHEGEVHALLGENGAGKSTLIKILNGVYAPTSGEIYVKGSKVDIHNVSDAQKLHIGIIFQEFNLCPDISVAENIYIGRQKKNRFGLIDKKGVLSDTQVLLDRLGLTYIKPADIVRTLSTSQMQMVEIAKAMSFDSEVIVFDEPTASLTETEIQTLFRIIRDLCAQGKGIIYISHRMEELKEIADTVTVLRDGQKIGDSFRFRDKTMDELIRMMVGRELKDKYPVYQRKIGEVMFRVSHVKTHKLNVEHLEVRRGEIVGIAGLVGAGRTELARAIFGADKADSIEIELEGSVIENKTPSQSVMNGIAYLTEDRKYEGLALRMDIEKNLNMTAWDKWSRYGIVSEKKERQNAEKQVDDMRIKISSLRQRCNELSGGNQQKVVIGKWLSIESKILIFDEPTRGIDVGVKYEIYKLMNELSDRGVGIIMISSELPEILGMSDRIYTMCGGRINGELPGKGTTQEDILTYIAGLAQKTL